MDDIFEEFVRILEQTNTKFSVAIFLMQAEISGQSAIYRINYIYNLLQQLNLFPDFANLKEEKSDEKSVALRQEGNTFFKYRRYVEALRVYNQSMCYAVSKENLSVALANRSAAFHKMEMFSECLDSIQLLRETIHPQTLQVKLAEREANCKEELKKCPKEEVFVPKIGLPVNEKIPFMAKCLELRENKTFGRHIVTKEYIPAGTIIAIENAYSKVPGDRDKYLRCATCLLEIPHRLFPCQGCTQTMFCSKECQDKASGDFHDIECEIAGPLFRIFNDVRRLACRLVVSAFLAFPDIDAMGPALERIEREKKTIFSFDWTKPLSREELYTPIHNLVTRNKIGLHYYVGTCLIFNLLKGASSIFRERFLMTKTSEDLLKNIIFKHMTSCPINGHALDDTHVIEPDQPDDKDLGGAIYGLRGLINHSCFQNVTAINVGGASGILALMNIPAGEQIYTNYGKNHHSSLDRATRRENLMEKYSFHCKCAACIEDYPLLHMYPVPRQIPLLPLHPSQKAENRHKISFKYAAEGFHVARDFIHKYGHDYPKPMLQLEKAHLQLKYSLNLMCGNIRLKIREESREKAQEQAARLNANK